jgi:hypothetical protein
MAVTILVVSTIGAVPERVFDLKLDVDVHAASQHGSGETAATRDGRRRLLLGDEVTFRARHFGIRWRMTSRITAYERPCRFVDEQIRGPFRIRSGFAPPRRACGFSAILQNSSDLRLAGPAEPFRVVVPAVAFVERHRAGAGVHRDVLQFQEAGLVEHR